MSARQLRIAIPCDTWRETAASTSRLPIVLWSAVAAPSITESPSAKTRGPVGDGSRDCPRKRFSSSWR